MSNEPSKWAQTVVAEKISLGLFECAPVADAAARAAARALDAARAEGVAEGEAKGRREALEEALRTIAAEREAFKDPAYAGGPNGSFNEIFACNEVERAIRAQAEELAR